MELKDLYTPDPREPYRGSIEQLPTVYVDDESPMAISIASMLVIAAVVVVIGSSILLAVAELLAPLTVRFP